MQMIRILTLATILFGTSAGVSMAQPGTASGTPAVAVGPQYDTTHVYVAPGDFDPFVASLVATFGGTTSKQGVFSVTPTPSSTMSQLVLTPVGTLSVFGFKTSIPYPFGLERTGYLVSDLDVAVRAARAAGADVIVAPFNDPIGRDAVIQWPGGGCKRSPRTASTCPPTGPTPSSATSWRFRTARSFAISPQLPGLRLAGPPRLTDACASNQPSVRWWSW